MVLVVLVVTETFANRHYGLVPNYEIVKVDFKPISILRRAVHGYKLTDYKGSTIYAYLTKLPEFENKINRYNMHPLIILPNFYDRIKNLIMTVWITLN